MHRTGVVALLVLAVLLAGCTGDDPLEPTDPQDTGGSDPQGGGAEDPGDPGERPTPWESGQAWTYRTSFGDELTLVVTDDRGGDWIVDTTNPDTAWFHTREEVSYLGPIRKSDLAGSQGDDPVRYYDFPLEEGKSWSTPWDGVERTVRTVEANGTYRFEAYEDGNLTVEYDYDPETGWFTELFYYHNETGEITYSLERTTQETGWQGQVVRWDAEQHAGASITGIGGIGGSFTVPEGVEELWVQLWFQCPGDDTTGSFQFLITPQTPSQQTTLFEGGCMDEAEILIIEEPEPTAWHTWTQVVAFSLEESATVELEAWSRNQVLLDVP